MIVGKGIWRMKAIMLHSSQFPQMQDVLRAAHFFCLPPPRVGQGEEIKQVVIYEPGKVNNFVLRAWLFQQEGRTTVETHQCGNLLARDKVAS